MNNISQAQTAEIYQTSLKQFAKLKKNFIAKIEKVTRKRDEIQIAVIKVKIDRIHK